VGRVGGRGMGRVGEGLCSVIGVVRILVRAESEDGAVLQCALVWGQSMRPHADMSLGLITARGRTRGEECPWLDCVANMQACEGPR
jgi:hypothetical protein